MCPPTYISQIPAGHEFPPDQKLYLLRNEKGVVGQRLRSAADGAVAVFHLGFTTLEKARAHARALGGMGGGLPITGILEFPMSEYIDRDDAPLITLDVDPQIVLA